jgi:hypothetical protein
MLTRDMKQLRIFDDFWVDNDLPKFRKPPSEDAGMDEESFGEGSTGSKKMSRPFRARFQEDSISGGDGSFADVNASDPRGELTLLQRFFAYLLDRVSPPGRKLLPSPSRQIEDKKPTEEPPPEPEMTVQEFFSGVKDSGEALTVVEGRIEGYQAALRRAHQTGQKALQEALEAGVEAARAETRLMALGVTSIVSEETMVEFVMKSPKGLRMDWVRNFTRHIPDDVLEAKVKCDEEGAFDNYAVLHYDPDKKSYAETQAEIEAERERRKDPILFGLIEGRRQLYFIGEWVDEFCDLSLDQIADVLGQDATTELDPEVF